MRGSVKWGLVVGSGLIALMVIYAAIIGFPNRHCHSGTDFFYYVLFAGEDKTQFAPNYSEDHFFEIRRGMSKDDVTALLGEPLEKNMIDGGSYVEVWRYTHAPQKTNYWFRLVLFDKDGKVTATEAKYFVG